MTFYAAFDSQIHAFTSSNIQRTLYTLSDNKNEINQIALNDKDNFLAACDDGGDINVYDVYKRILLKTLRFKHTNICSTVVFRTGLHASEVSKYADNF